VTAINSIQGEPTVQNMPQAISTGVAVGCILSDRHWEFPRQVPVGPLSTVPELAHACGRYPLASGREC